MRPAPEYTTSPPAAANTGWPELPAMLTPCRVGSPETYLLTICPLAGQRQVTPCALRTPEGGALGGVAVTGEGASGLGGSSGGATGTGVAGGGVRVESTMPGRA